LRDNTSQAVRLRDNTSQAVRLRDNTSQAVRLRVFDDSERSVPTRKVAPRLFCDICDMFDLHDTDDCPVQASSSSPMPAPVDHQPSHLSTRPYCDICEGNVQSVCLWLIH